MCEKGVVAQVSVEKLLSSGGREARGAVMSMYKGVAGADHAKRGRSWNCCYHGLPPPQAGVLGWMAGLNLWVRSTRLCCDSKLMCYHIIAAMLHCTQCHKCVGLLHNATGVLRCFLSCALDCVTFTCDVCTCTCAFVQQPDSVGHCATYIPSWWTTSS